MSQPDVRKLKPFQEMTAEQRRCLLDPDHRDVPHSLRSLRLAQLWAECDEDEILMRMRHADEIADLLRGPDSVVYKIRLSTSDQGIWVEDLLLTVES